MKTVIRRRILGAATVAALTVNLLLPADAGAQTTHRIRIRMGNHEATATLNDSEAARDLFAMLPLSIEMDDLFRREKTGILPARLSERTPGVATYELGDLGYWRPRNSFVIFYRHDGETIPSPGIVRLGKVGSQLEIFDVPGTVRVTVQAID